MSTLRQTRKPVSLILDYRNERLLRRHAADHHISTEEADCTFKALKEFLIVCAVKDGVKITSEPIDLMWHTFLLFTKDYQEFCHIYLGKFIHHEPFDVAAPLAYIETRNFAEKLFGSLNETLWPHNAKADCSSGCGE